MSFPKYPEYKDSGISSVGEIPSHWTPTRLKWVVEPKRPITYGIVQAGPDIPEGIPYIRPADMTDESGVADFESMLRTSEEIALAYTRSSIHPGDLVCSIGPSFGKVMVTPPELEGANLTQGTARVAISSGNNPRFFFWCLRSAIAYNQWEASVGGATFRALNLGPLAATDLPCPPEQEQSAIATFLDRETAKIDALVAEQEKLIELLKEKRQAVISHAVTKGLDPNVPMKDSGAEWLGEVPEHWTVFTFRHLLRDIFNGLTANQVEPSEDTVPVTRIETISTGMINHDRLGYILRNDARDDRRLIYGDICFSNINSLSMIGNCAIFDMESEIYAGMNLLVLRPKKFVDPYWMYFLVRSSVFRQEVESLAKPAINQASISQGSLLSICIPLPAIQEQEKISKYLFSEISRIDNLLTESQRAIDLLKERRSALISAAVTGKIDVRGLTESTQ